MKNYSLSVRPSDSVDVNNTVLSSTHFVLIRDYTDDDNELCSVLTVDRAAPQGWSSDTNNEDTYVCR